METLSLDRNVTNHGVDTTGHPARSGRLGLEARERLAHAGLHDGGDDDIRWRGNQHHACAPLFRVHIQDLRSHRVQILQRPLRHSARRLLSKSPTGVSTSTFKLVLCKSLSTELRRNLLTYCRGHLYTQAGT